MSIYPAKAKQHRGIDGVVEYLGMLSSHLILYLVLSIQPVNMALHLFRTRYDKSIYPNYVCFPHPMTRGLAF
jgi:hypothetical protein